MTAIFTPAEIEEIRAQAKEEAKALLMKELLNELVAKTESKAEQEEEATALEDSQKSDNWVLEPIAPAEAPQGELISVIEAARAYGVNRQSIYKQIHKGKLAKTASGKVGLDDMNRVFGHHIGCEISEDEMEEAEKTDDDFASDEFDTFAKVNIYGVTLRVNKSGTKVEVYSNGAWKERKIQGVKYGNKASYVVIPNSLCPQSKSKSGLVSVEVGRLVLEAFTEMPQYIQDVYYSKRGPSILFGLRLVRYKKDKQTCGINDVEWIDEKSFQIAVKAKLKSNHSLAW